MSQCYVYGLISYLCYDVKSNFVARIIVKKMLYALMYNQLNPRHIELSEGYSTALLTSMSPPEVLHFLRACHHR